jgi:hypothetical protein
MNQIQGQINLYLEIKMWDEAYKIAPITEIFIGEDEMEDIGDEMKNAKYQIDCEDGWSYYLDKNLKPVCAADDWVNVFNKGCSAIIWEQIDDDTMKAVVRSI